MTLSKQYWKEVLCYMAKEKIAIEWFSKGKKDIDDAEFLLKNNRAAENISFHIQQAAEKYIKGFLIYNEWKLEKIHDLVKLIEEAIKIDKSFKQFIGPMRRITNFYFESRYPVGYKIEYTKKELKEAIKQTKNLINLINKKSKFKGVEK